MSQYSKCKCKQYIKMGDTDGDMPACDCPSEQDNNEE
jgi:hypothetical protein